MRKAYRQYVEPTGPVSTGKKGKKQTERRVRFKTTEHNLHMAGVGHLKASLVLERLLNEGAGAFKVADAQAFVEEMRLLVVRREEEHQAVVREVAAEEALQQKQETAAARAVRLAQQQEQQQQQQQQKQQ
jgi:hypothetical protein